MHVDGPDGAYEMPAHYLVGADCGTSARASSQASTFAATADVAERITVAVGRPTRDVPATALLVRPDGYVAWASSETEPDLDDLRGVPHTWFGITSR